MRLTDEELIQVHNAIHQWDGQVTRYVKIRGQKYKLAVTPRAGVRCVVIDDVKYVEQNLAGDSEYARLARQEEAQVTWAIPTNESGKQWGLIINGEIKRRL